MKLIVGLGNPGRKYADTRHNVGFWVLRDLAKKYGLGRPRSRFQGELIETRIGSEKVVLLCPLTYMNNSGNSVQPACDFYRTEPADVLVVCDDFNLPLGQLRFRAKGSSGGQKGLADILRRLGTDTIPRLRIGIGSPPENWDVADYVLSRFSRVERPVIDEAVGRAVAAIGDWLEHGIEHCMNQYN